VRGKKSTPGRTLFSATTVASTLVSPYWASTAPSAWRARRPVSRLSLRPPHSISTRCVSNICRLVSRCSKRQVPQLPGEKPGPAFHLSRGDVSLLPRDIPGPLAADSQTLDDLLIALLVPVLDVVEKPAAQAHHLEQAAPRMVVVLVQLEVFGEPID